MSFIESYKHLDKICGEMFETQYGVSAYIEEMLNNPHGSFLVRGWENDLKQLKHYRWKSNRTRTRLLRRNYVRSRRR